MITFQLPYSLNFYPTCEWWVRVGGWDVSERLVFALTRFFTRIALKNRVHKQLMWPWLTFTFLHDVCLDHFGKYDMRRDRGVWLHRTHWRKSACRKTKNWLYSWSWGNDSYGWERDSLIFWLFWTFGVELFEWLRGF